MAVFYNIMFYGGLTLAIIFAITAIVIFFVMKIPAAIGDVTGSTAKKKIEEIREKGYESVQGVGAAKKDAIKSTSTKISVRDVQSSSSRHAEKGRENYEKAVADINNKKKPDNDIREMKADTIDVLPENRSGARANVLAGGEYEEATDVLRDEYEGATDVLRDEYEEATDVLRESDEKATDILRFDDDEATDVLRSDDDEATDVLRSDDDEATDVLRSYDDEATDVLRSYDDEATDVLRSDDDEATDVLRDGMNVPVGTGMNSNVNVATSERTRASSVTMIKDVMVVHSEEEI